MAALLLDVPDAVEAYLDALFDAGDFDMLHAPDALESTFGLDRGRAGTLFSCWRRELAARRGVRLAPLEP